MQQESNALKISFDKIAKSYDEEINTFHHGISSFVTTENLLFELPKNKNIRILDSGGGTGKFTLYLKKLGYDVALSDISSESIEEAKRKAADQDIKIETYICNSESTPFNNDSFDFIMMNGGVISYTPNPISLLHEANRILKRGGLLWFDFLNSLGWAIETQQAETKAELALENEKLIQMPDWDYPARLFSLDRIKQLLNESKFKLKSQYGLVLLSNSLSIETRYSIEYDLDLLEKYKKIELYLSRQEDCIGASWGCSICAEKT